jgi:2-polyprenyl-6-hydroxyphenyl methylase/3-demethylubiquinone-9 3-methyltransferase
MGYPDDGIGWHSSIASTFDLKYCRSKTFIERYKVWTELVARYSDPKFRVLDIGCGTGVFTFFAAKHNSEIVGIDASGQMIDICRKKKKDSGACNVDFLEADLMSLPDAVSGKVDLILCSSVLEYLDDVCKAVRVVASLLRNGGILLCSMPNKSSLYRLLERVTYQIWNRPRYYRYVKNVCTVEALRGTLGENNLNVEAVQYYSKIPILSHMLRPLGLAKYSDSLFVMVARKDSDHQKMVGHHTSM